MSCTIEPWSVTFEETIETSIEASMLMVSSDFYKRSTRVTMEQQSRVMLLPLTLGALIGAAAAALLASNGSSVLWPVTTGFIGGWVIGIVLLVVIVKRRGRSMIREGLECMVAAGGLGPFPMSVPATIEEEGLRFESPQRDTLMKWGRIPAIESHAAFLLVFGNPSWAYAIPVSAFRSESEASQFYAEIVNRNEAAKRA